jgi:chlorobactene glucosyltransferase
MSTEWLAALPWAVPLFGIPRLAGTSPSLNEVPPVTGVKLSVIIPARNESTQIETVLGSVLATTYSPVEVIVVDDRSSDDTARKVAAIAATDARLRLVLGRALPRGWYGKPWACHQGAEHATGDVLVFIDADTRHHPELMARAVSMLQHSKADLLTVAPRQLVLSFWERVIMPQVWVMLGIRYHPSSVNKATKPWGVIANGQFMMFPRASYAAAGGHASVRGEVVEDLAMAQRVVALGKKLYFAFAYDLMETRMYQTLGQVVEGWSKNVFIGARISLGQNPVLRFFAPFLMALNGVFWLLPPVVALIALTGPVPPPLLAPAAIATGLSVLFWSLISFGMQAPLWYGLLYPLGAAMFLWILARSAWRGTRHVEWRGRVYDEVTGLATEPAPPSGPGRG